MMTKEEIKTKVEEKGTKKLDEPKETPGNKKAVAESEGKGENLATDNTDYTDSKKVESKPAVEKAAKAKKADKVYKKKSDAAELTREYIVPMRKGFMNVPHYRRAKKAVKTLKEFMVRHMGIRDRDTRKIKIDINLNNEIWFRGIKKPLHKIKVNAVKKEGIVYVTLADPADYVKFKMARDEKKKAAQAASEKPAKVATPTRQSVPLEGKKEKVEADKDKDGVDDKKEEAEDKKAGTEKAAKTAKIENKAEKQTAKGEHKQKIASTKGLK